MFEIGDAVLVIGDYESNNCKDKTGVIVKLSSSTCEIEFDADQNINYKKWWVVKSLIEKQNKGEY